MPTSTIDLLLNWGPIVFLVVVPFASWLLSRDNGIRLTLRLGAVMCVVSCLLRLIPCWLDIDTRQVCMHCFTSRALIPRGSRSGGGCPSTLRRSSMLRSGRW